MHPFIVAIIKNFLKLFIFNLIELWLPQGATDFLPISWLEFSMHLIVWRASNDSDGRKETQFLEEGSFIY